MSDFVYRPRKKPSPAAMDRIKAMRGQSKSNSGFRRGIKNLGGGYYQAFVRRHGMEHRGDVVLGEKAARDQLRSLLNFFGTKSVLQAND